jgi:hypothetical protein
MVKLTQRQLDLVKVVQANPGIALPPMLEKAGFKSNSRTAYEVMRYLKAKKVLIRTGKQKSYRHYVDPDLKYELVKVSSELDSIPHPDSLIDEASAITLSEDQVFYMKNHHQHMPRKKLAERLGISKLALNLFLIKNNMETKSREAI